MSKFVVFGASGMVGTEVIKELSTHHKNFIGVLRNPSNKFDTNKQWINSNIMDFPNAELKDSHVICCLGSSLKQAGSKANFIKIAVTLVVEIAKKSKKAGAKSFTVISGINASEYHPLLYVKSKGMLEAQLKALDLPCLNIVRPSILTGNRQEFRPLERLAILALNPISPFFFGPLLHYKPMPARKLARSLIYMAEKYKDGLNILSNDEIHEKFKQ
jgi:uncharacterized protein YbjT (DUF2867 family)